jgi:hypothetical protein
MGDLGLKPRQAIAYIGHVSPRHLDIDPRQLVAHVVQVTPRLRRITI